ncbi:MAG: diguanylate cyclase [Fibromonadaceae bacterium]|jgi:diguanylate cyclase (GGDEF)-like protein|nr:diguanylate cyclase [Fibromonadaceae bacterium]
MNDINDEKKRILIVDDDRSNILALNHILKPAYSTLAAIDGQKGIEIAKTVIPDLILLDVVMPGMSGFEVLTELKHNDITSEIPVIFITALDKSEDEEKGLSLGAADYITKPFSNPIVKVRVKTQLKIVDYIREIKRFGVTDTLTGLPNRRSLNQRIKIEWGRALREREPLSVLMVDADNFKIYNDTHGHMQGDIHLQTMAKILQKSVERSGDFVARWGGEEFTVLLPNTNLDSALSIAERIRLNIKEATSTTVSIGVNSKIPTIADVIDDFFTKADEALYAAKKAGRDRVCAGVLPS